MKSSYSCNVVFNDLEGNVRGLFSTEHILNCFFENKLAYKKIIEDINIKLLFDDNELLSTAEIFFANNLNILKASKASFMHRNTLNYRLDKIKKLTGLNIKNFEDAAVFQNLICVKKLLDN